MHGDLSDLGGGAATGGGGGGAATGGGGAATDIPSLVTTPEGVVIAVHDLGGAGRPIVFAHATGFHGLVWQPTGARLADEFHCISLDHRGHGDSTGPADGNFEWRGFGDDILAVIDALDLQQPFGVGHSAGGAAMLLAEEVRPGTFGALYLYEPVIVAADPPLGRDPDNWLAEGARRRREVFSTREQAYATYASKSPFDRWDPDALAAYVEHGFGDRSDDTVSLKCRPEDEAVVYEMATEHDGFVHLGEVRCSVMLAAGSESETVAVVATTEMVVERLAHGQIEKFAGLGHFGPMEDPATVSGSIRRFLRAVESANGGA